MRLSLAILFLIGVAPTSLMAQEINLILSSGALRETLRVQQGEVDSLLEARLKVAGNEGFWDARIEVAPTTVSMDTLHASLLLGEYPHLEEVHFQGLSQRDARYLTREYKRGKTFILSMHIKNAEQRIMDMGFKFSGTPQVSKDPTGNYHLTYSMTDRPDLRIQGLASFNQSSTADTLSWFGEVNVSIPNFDGQGKSIDFAWRRLKANTESFHAGLRYPWVFQFPFELAILFSREVIDGNYQVIESHLNLQWDLDWERSIYFSLENSETIITLEGRESHPEWEADRRKLIGLGFRQSSLNTASHHGLSIRTSLFQEINFEPQAVRRLQMRSEMEYPLGRSLYYSQRNTAVIHAGEGRSSDPSILQSLGGVHSVRGFEEAYLRAPHIGSVQQTLHYSLGGQSQLLTFYDLGFFSAGDNIKHIQGFGIGLQLNSAQGPIRLIIASHKGVKFGNSFFHIEYAGGIPWIDR